MSDLDPDTPSTPIIVPDSPVQAQVSTAVRDIALVLGAVTTVLGIISKRDLAGFISFIQSSDFIVAAGIVVTILVPIWRQWHARRAIRKQQILNNWTPSSVSMTKTQAAEEKLP